MVGRSPLRCVLPSHLSRDMRPESYLIKSLTPVKVQYPDIQDMYRGDIATISILTRGLALFFPQFTFTWILPEFQSAMEMELGPPSYSCHTSIVLLFSTGPDFRKEAANGRKTAELFKDERYLYIPKVYDVRSLHITSHLMF